MAVAYQMPRLTATWRRTPSAPHLCSGFSPATSNVESRTRRLRDISSDIGHDTRRWASSLDRSSFVDEDLREERRKRVDLMRVCMDGETKAQEVLAELACERGLRGRADATVQQALMELQDIALDREQLEREHEQVVNNLASERQTIETHLARERAAVERERTLLQELENERAGAQRVGVAREALEARAAKLHSSLQKCERDLEAADGDFEKLWGAARHEEHYVQRLRGALHFAESGQDELRLQLHRSEEHGLELRRRLHIVQEHVGDSHREVSTLLRQGIAGVRVDKSDQADVGPSVLSEQKVEEMEMRFETKVRERLQTAENEMWLLRMEVSTKERSVYQLEGRVEAVGAQLKDVQAQEAEVSRSLMAVAPSLTALNATAASKVEAQEARTADALQQIYQWRNRYEELESIFIEHQGLAAADAKAAEEDVMRLTLSLRASEAAVTETAVAGSRAAAQDMRRLEDVIRQLQDKVAHLEDQLKESHRQVNLAAVAALEDGLAEGQAEAAVYQAEAAALEDERRLAVRRSGRLAAENGQLWKDLTVIEADASTKARDARACNELLQKERGKSLDASSILKEAWRALREREREADSLREQVAAAARGVAQRRTSSSSGVCGKGLPAHPKLASVPSLSSPERACQVPRSAGSFHAPAASAQGCAAPSRFGSSLSLLGRAPSPSPVRVTPSRVTQGLAVGMESGSSLDKSSLLRRHSGLRARIEREAAARIAAQASKDDPHLDTCAALTAAADGNFRQTRPEGLDSFELEQRSMLLGLRRSSLR